jgi:hypothetical protein
VGRGEGERIPERAQKGSDIGYHGSMKTTIDIPREEMEEVLRHTHARTKRDAVVMAISDFNRRKRLEKLADQLGTFDNVMPLDELLHLREIG